MIDTAFLTLAVVGAGSVSALFRRARERPRLLRHGTRRRRRHDAPILEAVSAGLAQRGVATLRYQFPFMEVGSKRPDRPALAHAAVHAAVEAAERLAPDLSPVGGGRSFGGRMTSQARKRRPRYGVHGLAFLGFPLHSAGRPSSERGRHLLDIAIPMLFLQGTRDALADLHQLSPFTEQLSGRATLRLFRDADHAFHVPKRSGRTDADVMGEILDSFIAWSDTTILTRSG